MDLFYSVIIPVYNRPEEVRELLHSLSLQTYTDFEVVIVEDGSKDTCEKITEEFSALLNVKYFYKPNTGPGDSRNFGMHKANGNYFIILDSDCVLPKEYMAAVNNALRSSFVDCFGGADAALESFSNVQKAINFSMTSVLTTGGIRGASEALGKFQPRSFNMGISKMAFNKSGGFGTIHPGEDPDLTFKLWEAGYKTRLIPEAVVYHKRRIDWSKFKIQVNKFGKVRPVLDLWHPQYTKLTFWFPSFFLMGFALAILLAVFGLKQLMLLYIFYFLTVFILSTFQNKSIGVGLMSVWAVIIQFWGYGTGYLTAVWKVKIMKMKPENAFPELFFQ